MLKATFENKAATDSTRWPWELTPDELEEWNVAQADLQLKIDNLAAARKKAPKGPAANLSPEEARASTEVEIALRRRRGVKAELLAAVQRRLTPHELRD